MKRYLSKLVLLSVLVLFLATQVMAGTYTVRSGDSLWTISQEFGLSVEDIIEMNDLNNANTIYVGQNLRINKDNNGNNTSYTVRSGDLLWRIADRFEVTIQEIIELNNLEAPHFYIYIGQTLLIPGEEEV